MQYPGLPDNRLIVDGVDLTEKYGLVLADGYVLEPPEPKKYTIDIPGGNGTIDLSESIYNDVVYENRNQKFTFYVVIPFEDEMLFYPRRHLFEKAKTEVSNFLHGKTYDYKMTMDPMYTYHGRFTVSSYEHTMYDIGVVGKIEVNITSDPYKYRTPIVTSFDASKGVLINCKSGRKKVCPTIEIENPCVVIFKNKRYELKPGTWKINDIVFESGNNYIYFNTYHVYNMTWGDFVTKNITCEELKSKAIFEWYTSRGSAQVPIKTWEDISSDTWKMHIDQGDTWEDQIYAIDVDYIKPVYIKYDWGDL